MIAWKVRATVNGRGVWLQDYESSGASWHWSEVDEKAAHVFTDKKEALECARCTWNTASNITTVEGRYTPPTAAVFMKLRKRR